MIKLTSQTGIRIITYKSDIPIITDCSWVEELSSYPAKFKEKPSIHLFVDFRDFLEKWSSYKEDGFLKNFLLEGVKLTQTAMDTCWKQTYIPTYSNPYVTVEIIIFYIETLQIIVSKK